MLWVWGTLGPLKHKTCACCRGGAHLDPVDLPYPQQDSSDDGEMRLQLLQADVAWALRSVLACPPWSALYPHPTHLS